MASSIPQFQTLITVKEFRDLVNKHYEKQISEGQVYDARDIQRFNEVDEYTLMFIQHGQFGTSFDQGRALRVFDGSLSWRKRHNVYDISPNEFPADYFSRHFVYFRNHDKYNNPILHFVVRAFNKGHEDNEAIKRFITYNYEKHIREYPGQKIIVLFDMSEAGISNLDYDIVKFLINSAQTFYPGLTAYLLMYKMSFLLSAAWRLMRTWMEPEADQFVKFVDAKSITAYIPPDQLTPAMGGTSANDW